MTTQLLVGTSEIEITPSIGVKMAGSLQPRPSTGITDPLYVKAIVLESGSTRMAYAVFDIAILHREIGDAAVALASEAAGIPAANIVWSCTHTHSGPCTIPDIFPKGADDGVNREWLATLPAKLAACVAEANQRKVPVTMSRMRAYEHGLAHNRRLRFKDGREINTWLLNAGEEDVQCVGAAGPVDPEVGVLSFEDKAGRIVAVMFHFTMHANVHFGSTFCADYPAVVASRLRERFGPQVTTLFLPGACGDINNVGVNYRQAGDALANKIIGQMEKRKPVSGPVPLAIRRCVHKVPIRDFEPDQEARLKASQWRSDAQEFFRGTLADIRARGVTELEAVQHAWRIGDVAFATFPGEAFIGLGVEIKERSPFPWTYPVELCNDWIGYLVTEQAWKGGGYESLVASTGLVSVEGSRRMTEKNLEMLGDLYRA